MSTCFYYLNENNDLILIGKRQGAGPFCEKCGMSLASSNDKLFGTNAIHYSNTKWLNKCPICFKKSDDLPSVCSFTFSISPELLMLMFENNFKIFDEYHIEYSSNEFREILTECKIKFYHGQGE